MLPIQCVATSATLLGGEADRPQVARFASELFNETFSEQDIILGERSPIPAAGDYILSLDDYAALLDAVLDNPQSAAVTSVDNLAHQCGLDSASVMPVENKVGRILSLDKRVYQLQNLLSERAQDFGVLSSQLFPDLPEAQRIAALSRLVTLLSVTPDSSLSSAGSWAPMLTPRYHVYLRSLEGAFIRYLPDKEVLLNRRQTLDGTCFELALCRECGQHYLVGRLEGSPEAGYFVEAIRDPGQIEFATDFLLPLEDNNDFEPEEVEAQEQVSGHKRVDIYWLCLQCGAYWLDGLPAICEHGSDAASLLRVIRKSPREGTDSLSECASCGHRGPDPVKEVVHGADGPNAVIATTLYQSLPDDRKKVLAFVDGRQDAAFFAWYLQRTYEDILFRNLILRVSKELGPHSSEGLSVADLTQELAALLQEEGLGGPMSTAVGLKRTAWLAVLRELLTSERRISLEGTGCGRWAIRRPSWFPLPQTLLKEPWLLRDDEAEQLLFLLFDTLREARAVQLPGDTGVRIQWGEISPYPLKRVRLGEPRGEADVESWDSPKCKRTKLLAKLLQQRGLPPQAAQVTAVKTLRMLWQEFSEFEGTIPDSRQALLVRVGDGCQLHTGWWRFRALQAGDLLYVCNRCGKLHHGSVGGLCTRPACPGRLEETKVADLPPNHYREMYNIELPGMMRVEEHTAQLNSEKAREFQRAFKDGHIGVLSSSTTFELGVDLGDLDTVFLRNVPPEAFNYAQRVGRAGRRPDRWGLAVSYCRRSPHDLYHFAHPDLMLGGHSRAPLLNLCNSKIVLRHVTAVILSRFFRTYPERFGSVKAFFVDPASPCAAVDVRDFAQQHRHEHEQLLKCIVPPNMWPALGLDDGTWVDRVAGTGPGGQDSRLADAEREFAADYQRVRAIEQEASARRQHERAKWAKNRAVDLESEDVLSFLSRKAIIPKYGFPVDVVELDTQARNQDIELQRDRAIAISEYAPTAEVVANKKVWESYGIKIVPDRPPRVRYYRKCLVHNRFDAWDETEAPPEPVCCREMSSPQKYVIPWFGFVTKVGAPSSPNRRPEKLFTSRPFFVRLAGPERGHLDMPHGQPQPFVRVTKACPGQMTVICEGHRGQNFYICLCCGAGFRTRVQSHKTPHGADCHGRLQRLALGHEFITDIVRLDFLYPPPSNIWHPIWFAYSLGYALANAASDTLEVPPTDLSATVGRPQSDRVPPIILYDNAPGGAGLVVRLEDQDVLRACLESARARVSGACGCGDDDSCYGCLRSYTNQFAHTRLRRGPVFEYLTALLDSWPARTVT